MEFEISDIAKSGLQLAQGRESRANADPDDYAKRHKQGCYIPEEECTACQQMG